MSRAVTPKGRVLSAARVSGLYAVTPEERDTEVLVEKVRLALAGGARLLQYRSKSADRGLQLRQAGALSALCRKADVPFVVNDDLELALQVDADGLHVGRGDVDILRARSSLGDGKILGASCYNDIDIALSASSLGADYVAFGSVFPSSSKPKAVRAEVSLFRQSRERLALPVVAIGGITPENAPSVIDAGADAVAVIGALFEATDIVAAARSFERLFQKNRP